VMPKTVYNAQFVEYTFRVIHKTGHGNDITPTHEDTAQNT